MTDYRFQALQKSLQKETSSIDLKEGGGLLSGFFDEKAAENQREYLQLLELAFQHMKTGELDDSKCRVTLQALSSVFSEECDELEALCLQIGGLDDALSAWQAQTDDICAALEHAEIFFEEREPTILDEAYEVIRECLAERLPLYGRVALLEQEEDGDS